MTRALHVWIRRFEKWRNMLVSILCAILWLVTESAPSYGMNASGSQSAPSLSGSRTAVTFKDRRARPILTIDAALNTKVFRPGSKTMPGPIPKEIFRLFELTHLILEDMALVGSIPEDIDQLKNLTFLHLGRNMLTGAVPKSIERLSQLSHLLLNHNHLTHIAWPHGGENQTALQAFIYNNPLTSIDAYLARRRIRLSQPPYSKKDAPHAHFDASVLHAPHTVWQALHTFASNPFINNNAGESIHIAFVVRQQDDTWNYHRPHHAARISIRAFTSERNSKHIDVRYMSRDLKQKMHMNAKEFEDYLNHIAFLPRFSDASLEHTKHAIHTPRTHPSIAPKRFSFDPALNKALASTQEACRALLDRFCSHAR